MSMTRNISYSQYNNQQIPQSQLMTFNQNQQQTQQSILKNGQPLTQTTASKVMKQSSSVPFQMK